MAGRYAENTSVSSDASRAEIERTLQRYGASSFAYGWEDLVAMIGFKMRSRQIKFVLTMPDPKARRFTHTEARGWERDAKSAQAEWEKACRQRWRALALVVKAKLEAVEAGITTFEDEFLAATMLPNGSTVRDWAAEQIETAYQTKQMPALLPGVQRALRAGQ
jgi:hypothetical protein